MAENQNFLRGADKAVASAAGMAGRRAMQAIGNTIAPVIGGIVGGAVGDKIGRGIYRFLQGAGAFLVAQAVAGFLMTVVAAAILVVFAAFAMFIINSGAYIVPPGRITTQPGSGSFPVIDVGTSCPIPNGIVLVGSYGSPYGQLGYGHGENDYWDGVGQACTAYPLGGCYAKQLGDYCFEDANLNKCPTYGYAADFIYPSSQVAGQPVYLPYIEGDSVDWVAGPVVGPPTREQGSGLLTANHNGTIYSMYVAHLETAPVGGVSGGVIGTLSGAENPPHLHVELRIDGSYVPPEFMCTDQAPVNNEAEGWVVVIPRSQLTNLVASTPTEYARQTCPWSAQKNLTFAVNANFFEGGLPVSPAGFGGSFTNRTPNQHADAAFMTFVLDNNNNPRIIGGNNSGGYFYNDLPAELQNLSQYKLAVTGVTHDSFSDAVANSTVGRTVLGLDGTGNVYLGVFPSATVQEALSAVQSEGATQAFHLDGGGSSTLCQDGVAVFGGSRTVGNSIGTTTGDIIELE